MAKENLPREKRADRINKMEVAEQGRILLAQAKEEKRERRKALSAQKQATQEVLNRGLT